MSASARRRLLYPVLCLLIIAASTALQLGCLSNHLVIDDYTLIFNQDGGRGCDKDPGACFNGRLFYLYYRPVLTASFAAVQKYHIHDNSARAFHIDNLILHALVVALALWVFRLILRRRLSALIAGCLFACHPVQVTVTSFIGGRTDTLALLFLLLFVGAVFRCGSHWCAWSRRGSKAALLHFCFWIAVSLLALTGAAFTKEQVIPIAALTPLFVRWRSARTRAAQCTEDATYPRVRRPVRHPWLVVYLAPAALYAWAAHRVMVGDSLPAANWSAGLHLEMVGRTIWYFVKILFAPTITTLHQSTLGPWDVTQRAVEFLGLASGATWLTLGLATWHSRRLRTLWLWSCLTLVTCLNIVPIPSQFASPYRAAIPLFGVAGMVGWMAARCCDGLKRSSSVILPAEFWVGCGLALSLGWCAIVTVKDVPNWHDEIKLMDAEVNADPNYVQARSALANYWSFPLDGYARNYEKSLAEYRICIAELFGSGTPPSRFPQMVRSAAMTRTFHSAGGLRWNALTYLPPMIRGYGGVYHNLGRYEEAIEVYKAVLELTPDDESASTALANCYGMAGEQLMNAHNYTDAIAHFRAGLQLWPDNRYLREDLITASLQSGKKMSVEEILRMEGGTNPGTR